MTQEQKLDEALRQTFPASDAFWVAPEPAVRRQELHAGDIMTHERPP